MFDLKSCLATWLVAVGLLLQLVEAASQNRGLAGRDSSLNSVASLSYENITSTLDEIIARGYLIVGTTGDYKPFTYLVSNTSALPNSTSINTTYIGSDIDEAQSLSNALGLPHPVQFVRTAWANYTSDLLAGKFDLGMGGISITVQRARMVFFSTGMLRGGKTACIRCSDASKFTSLASIDVEGVTVVVNPGGTNEAFDRENLKAATILLVADNNAVYQAVLDGTADAMISDSVEIELQTKLHPGELCTVDSALFTFDEKSYMMGRDVAWQNFVNTWVNIELGSGAWNTTLEKWLDYAWPAV